MSTCSSFSIINPHIRLQTQKHLVSRVSYIPLTTKSFHYGITIKKENEIPIPNRLSHSHTTQLYTLSTKHYFTSSTFVTKRSVTSPKKLYAHGTLMRMSTNTDSQNNDEIENSMDNLYQEWTLEHDKYLYKNRELGLPRLASILGRGLRGVQSRLDKLTDVNSPAYIRLFVENGNHKHMTNTLQNENTSNKSQSLTPAIEILRRIRWDTTLISSDFSIMYYDRVDNTLHTCAFDQPNKSVKGKEPLFVFAIPEHRISVIKYKDRIVWDKEQRLDFVFGSMNGNGMKIEEIIDAYPSWKAEKDKEKEINRLRQIEVSKRLKMVLGERHFTILKEQSRILIESKSKQLDQVFDTKDVEIQNYVKFALHLFHETYPSIDQTNVAFNDEDDKSIQKKQKQNDLDFMFLFSELVALLPAEKLRESILAEIETLVAQFEGKSVKTSQKLRDVILPKLNEDDIEEKFVRGSGAGGQKVGFIYAY